MIKGAHVILYSPDADADRAFLRDVIDLGHVDVGDGWLIFGLPPAEVAIHPSEAGGSHELYLMCDDIAAFVAAMEARQVACTPPVDRGWGILTELTLPGGGKLGVYQPRHARPPVAPSPAAAKRASGRKPPPSKPANKRAKKPAPPKRKTAPKKTKVTKKAARPARRARTTS